MSEDRRQQLLQEARDAGEFQRYTDGVWRFAPLGLSDNGEVYDAFALRTLADELDRLNGDLKPPPAVDPSRPFK